MNDLPAIEKQAVALTRWVGSTSSIIAHTVVFALSFAAASLDLVSFDRMFLILTTAVSLEAIYLAIFIQMSVNRQGDVIGEVEHDIDEIQEDIEDIQEDVEDIGEDVEELQEDVEDITEEFDELSDGVTEAHDHAASEATLQDIYAAIQRLATDIETLKK